MRVLIGIPCVLWVMQGYETAKVCWLFILSELKLLGYSSNCFDLRVLNNKTMQEKIGRYLDKDLFYYFQILLQNLSEYCKFTTYGIYNNICLQ